MKIEDLTTEEVMHFVLLFCYNWTREDFEIAFKNSHLGWDYYWDRLQGKIQAGKDPTNAIVEIILNMDNTHKPMLLDYLFSIKYPKEIETKRNNRLIVEEQLKKHEQLRKNNPNNGKD